MKQNFRRSRILDHNIYQQTDRLYSPLRQALIQSSRSKQKENRLTRASSLFDLRKSQISNRLWEMSPEQADYLTKSIYIPFDKNLTPTNDISRVAGKQFVAIQTKVKQSGIINEHQFIRRQSRANQYPQQIVYKVQQQYGCGYSKETPIKQIQNSTQNRDNHNLISRMQIQEIQSGSSRMSQQKKKKLSLVGSKQSSRLNMQNPQQHGYTHNENYQNQYGFNNEKINEKFAHCGTQSYNSRMQSILTPYFQSGLQSSNSQQQGFNQNPQFLLNPITGRGISQQEKHMSKNNSVSSMQGQYYDNYFKLNENSQLRQGSRKNLQNFNLNSTKHSCDSNWEKQTSKSRYGRSKSNYKYNLFSALDYPVNNSCKGCGGNQIVAQRASVPWS